MQNRFATGKPVYGGGSYAPTRGQVDPSGYIQRELRKRGVKSGPYSGVSSYGADGQSDTRSGMASRALGRPTTTNPGGGGGPGGGHQPPINPHNPNPQSPNHHHAGPAHPPQGPQDPNHHTAPGHPPIGNGQPGQHQTPHVVIGKNGQLKLPFDMEYSQQLLALRDGMNADLLDLQQQSQQQAISYKSSMRDAAAEYLQQQRGTLNDNAGRGTAFSSGYGMQVGNDATAYNNFTNDLNTQNTAFNTGITQQRNQIQSSWLDQLRRLALQQGVKFGGQAGSLGYGHPSSNAHGGKNKHKNKGKKGGNYNPPKGNESHATR